MSSNLYKRFSNLCLKWPKDQTKAGRDYAEVFRQKFNDQFSRGEFSHVEDAAKLDAELSALERIANNSYYNENPLKRSSATGAEAWVCSKSISNEGLKQFKSEEDSLIDKLKRTLGIKYSGSESSQVESEASRITSKSEKKEQV